MNKTELVEYVAERTGAYKKDAKQIVNAVLDGIEHGLRKDKKVNLVNFGIFEITMRRPRTARNPKTGQAIRIPKKFVPTFRASVNLKKTIR